MWHSLKRVFLPSVPNNPVHAAQVLWEELLYRFIVCVFPSLFTAAQAEKRWSLTWHSRLIKKEAHLGNPSCVNFYMPYMRVRRK